MKEFFGNILGFIYSLSMGDYFFFIGTFLLIVLFVYVLYLIKFSELEQENDGTFDIQKACKQIEEEYKPDNIKLTSYEEEQEKTAIISYEELLKNRNNNTISYDDDFEYELPSLNVKKFNLNAEGSTFVEEPKLEVKLMSYDKEEAFLKALKELQSNLN